MKEFIEKLIGRLEEKKNKAEERYHKYLDNDNYCNLPCVFTIADIVQYKVEVLTEVKENVNQLAEEYINTSTDTSSGWIPCSERLPEKYGEYLCCDRYGEYIIGYPTARVSSDNYYVETEYEIMNDCIAWQPLPQPFKEEGASNE